MGLALKTEDFDLIPDSPSLDMGRAMAQAHSVNDFAKLVDEYKHSSLVWRTKLRTKFVDGLKKIEDKLLGADDITVRDEIFPQLDVLFSALERAMKKFEVPFHSRDEVPEMMRQIREKKPKIAKYLRKHLDRIEDVRVEQYNVCVELFYALVAFKSQFEDGRDEGEVFSDPNDLAAFLKSQVA